MHFEVSLFIAGIGLSADFVPEVTLGAKLKDIISKKSSI